MAKLTQLPTKKYLQENGWHYNKTLSIEEKENVYKHRFTAYKNGIRVALECEFTLYSDSGEVKINVYNRNSGDLYAPFYFYEYGNYDPILNVIHRNIRKETSKMGIIRDVNDYCW